MVPSFCHAAEAAISDSAPGPEWISAEVISGGNVVKSMAPNLDYRAEFRTPSGNADFISRTSIHEMELTAANSRGLNSAGMGIYPVPARSFWPAPIALCRNAFTAIPTWGSGYFEHTISYVTRTIG